MTRKQWFLKGMKAGIPISLGYFAVSIALGISARQAGIPAPAAALTSLLINASAGEHVGFTLIAAGASFLQVALMEAIAKDGWAPRIICESDGTQPEDALSMKKCYEHFLENK